MTTLTARQIEFCDKLKTMTNRSTGVRGLVYQDFPSGKFIVNDLDGTYVDDFGDITEALECLLCEVHNFRSVDPDTVFAVIEYLGLNKFAR